MEAVTSEKFGEVIAKISPDCNLLKGCPEGDTRLDIWSSLYGRLFG